MRAVYKLTPAEADILSNLDQSDVIATGPWVKGEMCVPHRGVIRDRGNELVVHTQCIGDGKAYYTEGLYVRKDNKDTFWFAYTWTKFDNRVRRLNGFE